ncbi:MAG: RdgB/HAM1 family non-canonical purine NTP pyrophosphatase [Bacillota bacterium]
MRRLVLATANAGKALEFRSMLSREGIDAEVLSLLDFSGVGEPPPEGSSYVSNAVSKATWAASATRHLALADDSGIEVDALRGAPGPFSSRYAGDEATDSDNIAKLLKEMEHIAEERRTARFRCVLALVDVSGWCVLREGTCEGTILRKPVGAGGFGYDPVFYYGPLGKTFAEMSMEEKNLLSHRARALEALVPDLKSLLYGA